MKRCPWAQGSADERRYHDTEWGVPIRDDTRLFELLVLEGAQAGLAWRTILGKRTGYRRAFAGFDPHRVAKFGDDDIARLVADPGIVRHRGKIAAAIGNARVVLALAERHGSFAHWLWGFVDDRPIVNNWHDSSQVPATSPLAGTISRELRAAGARFIGPTTCYAWLQAVGVVNDHLADCFRYAELATAPAGGPE